MSDLLKPFYERFRSKIEEISQACKKSDGLPKKEAVCAALVGCGKELATIMEGWKGDLCKGIVPKCRCSVEGKDEGSVKGVKALVDKYCDGDLKTDKIREFLVDFSFSSHDLRDVTGKKQDHKWKPEEKFFLWLAAESELSGDPRRDLLKLCLVNSFVKLLVYKQTDRRKKDFEQVIRLCCGEDPSCQGTVEWLFVGIAEKNGQIRASSQVLVVNSGKLLRETDW